MKYAVIQVTNGSFTVKSEHGENLKAARMAFHSLCVAIDGDKDFRGTAFVKVVDDQIDCVDGLQALFVVPAETDAE